MRPPGTELIFSRKDLVSRLKECGKVFMVYDRNVESFSGALALDAEIGDCLGMVVTDKTIDRVMEICRFLLRAGADRESCLLAVGGGTLTDIAGFAAAIYKRGIRCAYVPTTLLAQADASVGGKTGVTLDSFKNILGTFTAPLFVCDLREPLESLPRRELLSGLAEMLKTFLAFSPALYEKTVALASECGPEAVLALAPEAARLKADVVGRDPFEKGERRTLNLGHTFAHAIEWYEAVHGTDAPMSHGEAVSVGVILAAELSEREGIARRGLAAEIRRDFAACGLPTECPYPMEELEMAMLKDKKNRGSTINYVYIKEIGEVVWSV